MTMSAKPTIVCCKPARLLPAIPERNGSPRFAHFQFALAHVLLILKYRGFEALPLCICEVFCEPRLVNLDRVESFPRITGGKLKDARVQTPWRQ